MRRHHMLLLQKTNITLVVTALPERGHGNVGYSRCHDLLPSFSLPVSEHVAAIMMMLLNWAASGHEMLMVKVLEYHLPEIEAPEPNEVIYVPKIPLIFSPDSYWYHLHFPSTELDPYPNLSYRA